jgi:hypothetical protein
MVLQRFYTISCRTDRPDLLTKETNTLDFPLAAWQVWNAASGFAKDYD